MCIRTAEREGGEWRVRAGGGEGWREGRAGSRPSAGELNLHCVERARAQRTQGPPSSRRAQRRVNIHSITRSQFSQLALLAQSERPDRAADESAACFFSVFLPFGDTDLSGRIIINVKSKSAGFSPSRSLFFPLSPPLLLLRLLHLPRSSLHLASYYLLLLAVWSPSRWPAFLALWFCSGDFHLPPHRSLQIDS